jgi:atypical dual specificity phosphatase
MEKAVEGLCMDCGKKFVVVMGQLQVCPECQDDLPVAVWTGPQKKDPEIDFICDDIYIGNADASSMLEVLEANGIQRILVCGCYLQQYFPDIFEYFAISIDDSIGQNIMMYFRRCFEFMSKPGKLFVHCAAGVSRSVSMVVGFLIYSKRMKFDDALDLVQKQRPKASPNPAFRRQLRKLEQVAAEAAPDWGVLDKLSLADLKGIAP